MGKMRYIVWAWEYASPSAGIRCLYLLAHHLNQKGKDSLAFVTNSKLAYLEQMSPLISEQGARELLRLPNYAVIYPETLSGNPLGASKVIRWVLNKPGFLGGDSVYHPSEKVFTYSAVYSNYIKNPICGRLYIPSIDQSLFYLDPSIDSKERTLECFYVGKSHFRPGFFSPANKIEITRFSPSRSQLAHLLRRSKVLYCFDNSTILIYEAVLCGCPVVIIPDGSHTKEDFQKLELGLYGIAWGMDELDQALQTLSLFPSFYESKLREFSQDIDRFLLLTGVDQWSIFPSPSASAIPATSEPSQIEELPTEASIFRDELLRVSQELTQLGLRSYKTAVILAHLRRLCPWFYRFLCALGNFTYYGLRASLRYARKIQKNLRKKKSYEF